MILNSFVKFIDYGAKTCVAKWNVMILYKEQKLYYSFTPMDSLSRVLDNKFVIGGTKIYFTCRISCYYAALLKYIVN